MGAGGLAGVVPECAELGGAPAGCGTLSYPALLWEFDDNVWR